MTEQTTVEDKEFSAAAREVDRLSLVIESAVRNSDPTNCDAVTKALLRLRIAENDWGFAHKGFVKDRRSADD